MTDEDALEYRKRLTQILIEHGFGWVVDEAEAEISEGRTVTRQVSDIEEFSISAESGFEVRAPRRRRAELIASEPFAEVDRLHILLKGVRSAVVQREEIERSSFELLPTIDTISFVPEDLDSGIAVETRHTLRRGEVGSRTELAARLTEALSRLVEDRNVDRV